ncbi:hypothetical protein BC351_01035 [Paenibacillus ferrarius]|uniref:Uncharacterized protein n=1 Tax=Paenibacillus ferrarius TaxID=1469647 RepID=A0A1V4HSK0_9BACL|nr:hypothetical protein [Paenibacillus ferrarius]OPH61857.1 hypothetical protein BC351_01035 [Paenibacillus ferrarius]
MSNRPTAEEIDKARELALLEILRDIVCNNRDDLKLSSMTLKSLYVSTTDAVIDDINNDIRKIKLLLKQSEANLSKERSNENELSYVLHCRGYTEKFSILKGTAKPELGVLLKKYVQKIEKLLFEIGKK